MYLIGPLSVHSKPPKHHHLIALLIYHRSVIITGIWHHPSRTRNGLPFERFQIQGPKEVGDVLLRV